jgi:hypothetical protein
LEQGRTYTPLRGASCALPGAFCAYRRKRNGGYRRIERSSAIAIYHCSIKIISRGKGKSAVAAAAYRAGELIKNEYDGVTHDYTRKGGVEHTEILLPANALAEYRDRATLWNAVEKIEKAKNAQLAREIELALPAELSLLENKSLVRDYVKRQFVSVGMCADVCIHDKGDGNPHAHIMLTMRPFNEDKMWGAKSKKEYILDADGERIQLASGEYKSRKIPATDWNEQTKAEEWRAAWAEAANRYLEKLRHPARLDHRSYERQGVAQAPTIHLGVAAFQMEKRGIRTERGNINRGADEINKQLRQIKARIRKLEDWIQEIRAAPPTMFDIFSELTHHPERRSQRQQIGDIKLVAQTLSFIERHGIETLADMAAAIRNLHARYDEAHRAAVAASTRYQTLTEHIAQAEAYAKHTAVYRKYAGLKGAKQGAYYDKHREEIGAFSKAHEYITRHMNGHKKVPLYDWRRELSELETKRAEVLAESELLRNDLRSAEAIRRNAETVMGVEAPCVSRSRGLEI